MLEQLDKPLVHLWPDTGEALGWTKGQTYYAAKHDRVPVIRMGSRIWVSTVQLRAWLGGSSSAQEVCEKGT